MKSSHLLVIIAFVAGSVMFVACSQRNKPANIHVQTRPQKEMYTCEMHPEVLSDKPGNCPICGMQLVKKMVPDTTKVHMPDSGKKM